MSDTTPNLALPYILSAQAQKHVTHNEALRALDAIVQLSVVSSSQSTPPGSPTEGVRYIVGPGATGDWLNQEAMLATYQDGAWAFHTPQIGWQAWQQDLARMDVFDGTNWTSTKTASPLGAYTRLQTVEEELALSGGSTDAVTQIPNRAIVLGVSVRVTQTITGATSFEVGTATETSKFGGSLGISVGDTNIGVIGPTAFYAPTPVQITAIGGDFAGGSVQLALHYIECGPPLAAA